MDKRLKLIIVTVVIIISILSLIFFVRFIFGGPEDTWICSAGNWIKHGNPIVSMPDKLCN